MPRSVRPVNLHTITPRKLEVKAVKDVSPGMRRVTLTGEQLDSFVVDGQEYPAFCSEGFDDSFKIFFPYPGETEPVLPIFENGGVRFPKDPKPLARTYTVRNYNPDTRELDVDFVKHGVGVACTWAYRVQPGEHVHIAGPSATRPLPEGVDWFLIAGDETALPAIDRLIEELPDDARGEVFIEVAEDAHRYELREIDGLTVTWLVRDGAATGENSLLLPAVENVHWRDGQVWAWVAGEQAVVRDLRRHLVEVRGVDKAWIDFTGYWRRQTVVALEDDAAVPDPARNETSFSKLHEMAEILPPLAVRTAANLGIADLISRGTRSVSGLVAATGTNERALRKFLRYLEALELLEPVTSETASSSSPDEYRLSEVGEWLTNEHVLDHLLDDGLVARKEFAFRGLEHSVRTGGPAYQQATGIDVAQLRDEPEFIAKQLDASVGGATMFGPRLAASGLVDGAESIVIHSDGASGLAGAILSRFPDAAALIPAMPSAAEWIREDLPSTVPSEEVRSRISVVEQTRFDPTPYADVIIIARELGNHPDADAVMLLQRAAACLTPAGRILLVEPVMTEPEDGPDEHAAEADLLNLTLAGSGFHTAEELSALVEAAGLTVIDRMVLAGVTVHTLKV